MIVMMIANAKKYLTKSNTNFEKNFKNFKNWN